MDATKTPRLTTAEAAVVLHCKSTQALALLQAAGLPNTRQGKFGAFMWPAGEVERLAATLHKPATQDAAGEEGGAEGRHGRY